MRFVNVTPGGVLLDLDATDCTILADACDHAGIYDYRGDVALLAALGAVLRAGSVVAAFDTLQDNQVAPEAFLADVRRVWGPRDSADPEGKLVPAPLRERAGGQR